METLVLSFEDTQRIVQHVGLDSIMDEMIDRLTLALKQFNDAEIVVPARDGFHYHDKNGSGLIEWMPVMKIGEKATIKVVGYHLSNPRLWNLPTILSTVSAYDTTTGHLIGIADCTFLTALRTGAASAIASKILANPESETVGLIGCGAQAITQLHGLLRTFDIKKILIYDKNSEISQSFGRRSSCIMTPHIVVEESSIEELVRNADILCTATSVEIGEGPVFEDTETQPWVHINGAGSDFPGKIELPKSLLQRSLVCPDSLEQALESGECQQLSREEVGPTLVELLKDEDAYKSAKKQASVFDSTGWALEDQVSMEMLVHYAGELGLGESRQIESASSDSRNPYDFGHTRAFFSERAAEGL